MEPDVRHLSQFDAAQGHHWLLLGGFIVMALLGLWLSLRWDRR